MSRSHIAIQLLKHGPLTLGEFMTITGWKSYGGCVKVLSRLRDSGAVRLTRRGAYAVRELEAA